MHQFSRTLQLKIGNQNESIIIDHLCVTFSIKKRYPPIPMLQKLVFIISTIQIVI